MTLLRRTTRCRSCSDGSGDAVEAAVYRAAVATIAEACDRVARGDLEARVPALDGPAGLADVRHAINRLVDVTDAYVRESAASLRAASEGRFHRRFLLRGMPGAFADGARRINEAREAMRLAAERVAADETARTELADRLYEVASQVAAAATELGASAGSLSSSARSAVAEADDALATVQALETTSQEIQHAVTLIKQVAAQTRLLSLNATIEAARAGDAGLGFAVVAGEVKSLADEAASSSDDITVQVEAAQSAAAAAVAAISRIVGVVRDMDGQVDGVAEAAGGAGSGSATGGLSHMAETLREEIASFVAGPAAGTR